MNIKAFLLDFDGTVVLSEESRLWSTNKTLEKYNIVISKENWDEKYKRTNSRDMFEDLKKHYTIDESVEELYKRAKQFRSERIESKGLEVAKGFIDFYNKAIEHGIKILICSGGANEHIERSMKASGLPDIPFIGRDDYKNQKPNPDCYFSGMRLLGVSAQECLVIDDSYNGLLAGIKAGCGVIGINCRDEKGIEELDLINIVDDFTQISLEDFKYK